MKIIDLAKRKFLCFESDDTVSYAAKMLAEKNLREAPVLRQGKFIGMFTTSDIAAALVKKGMLGRAGLADLSKVKNELVYKHMSQRPIWLDPQADVLGAFAFLVHNSAGSIAVVDRKKGRRLVGVVLASDIRKEMAKLLAGGKEGGRAVAKELAASDFGGKTAIDQILRYVEKKSPTDAGEVAKQFKLSVKEVEEYADSLSKHGLLKVEYNIIGKMKLKKME